MMDTAGMTSAMMMMMLLLVLVMLLHSHPPPGRHYPRNVLSFAGCNLSNYSRTRLTLTSKQRTRTPNTLRINTNRLRTHTHTKMSLHTNAQTQQPLVPSARRESGCEFPGGLAEHHRTLLRLVHLNRWALTQPGTPFGTSWTSNKRTYKNTRTHIHTNNTSTSHLRHITRPLLTTTNHTLPTVDTKNGVGW